MIGHMYFLNYRSMEKDEHVQFVSNDNLYSKVLCKILKYLDINYIASLIFEKVKEYNFKLAEYLHFH